MIAGELQTAIFAALKAAPALADGRIYDRVPAATRFPYVTLGDEQINDVSTTCADGWELFPDVHCWSRPSESGLPASKIEVKQLAASVVQRVRAIDTLDGFALVSIEHQTTRVFRDPDGLTEHAVVSFRAVIDPG